jgi:hypothetical protein
MANGNPGSEEKRLLNQQQTKKTYSKPAFQFERVFETQALSCGKVGSQSGQCHTRSKTS